MNYGYVDLYTGAITAPVAMCSEFKGIKAWQTLSDEQRIEKGWYPCDVVGDEYDMRRQTRSVMPLCSLNAETQRISAVYLVETKPLDVILLEAVRGLAAYRLKIEEGGAAVPGGGKVLTSRADQSQLNSVYSTLKAGLVTTIDWKAPTGWISATLEDVEPLARISAVHVQSCFSAERQVSELLEAQGTVDDVLAIDYMHDFDVRLAALLAATSPQPPAETGEAST